VIPEKKPLFGSSNPFAKPSTSTLFGNNNNSSSTPMANLFAKPPLTPLFGGPA